MNTAVNDPDDFPSVYRSVDTLSSAAQRSYLGWFKIRLYGFLIAAVGGAIVWIVGPINMGGAVAFVAFAISLAAELVLALRRQDRVWHQGRAVAEHAKTLSWRYMAHGAPFETGVTDVDARFLSKLKDVWQEHTDMVVESVVGDRQISPAMHEVRDLDFEMRRDVYLRDRIGRQHTWYSANAALNASRAHRWMTAAVAFEFVGLIGAACKAAGFITVDLLGIFATAAAAAATWLQAKQYERLASVYGSTSQELAAVASVVESAVDERRWPDLVDEAEQVITHEHHLWRATLGIPARRP
ncbi:hypothetical protein AU196_14570 [Mycobacterium sp. IS-1742]|uniref:DUF4231 domain-containing protein n=1 Tax=Mycobacterium sp. IS-1742 TaxID=1772285 RepID=UPI00073FB63F|nr:DUF4231 domain-containing protein [Mycobacterium sp. IS-1742]KUI28926.1 hypothetical protein AU196_14570 [Mycobacterium sp. IS-1742]